MCSIAKRLMSATPAGTPVADAGLQIHAGGFFIRCIYRFTHAVDPVAAVMDRHAL
jgi:hypothetical protein